MVVINGVGVVNNEFNIGKFNCRVNGCFQVKVVVCFIVYCQVVSFRGQVVEGIIILWCIIIDLIFNCIIGICYIEFNCICIFFVIGGCDVVDRCI